MKEIFKKLHLYTILMQGISIIFIDQMPTYVVFKASTFCSGIRISAVYHVV